MNIEDLLYERILVTENTNSFSRETKVEEVKVLEISPSGIWTKIQNSHGTKFWKKTTDIVLVEKLE